MSIRRLLLLLSILLLIPFSLKLRGQDFGKSQSLFTDIKAHKVGDILTVLIVEQNRASNQVEIKSEKTSEASVSGGPGLGPLDFIPLFGADSKGESKHDGKGENLRNGSVRARMSVTVVDVRTNGDLIIEGTRIIGISNDKETLTLSGVVRSEDVSADNTVESYHIADAEITYSGKGTTNTASRPGFLVRLVNWIF